MRKIGCISQTYGNDRIQELKCIAYDDVGFTLRNCLDEISFTFHNCGTPFIDNGTSILRERFPTCKLRIINNINYRDSIIQQLKEMKSEGFTDFVLLQDDHYGINYPENIQHIKNIVEFYRLNPQIEMLYLSDNKGFPSKNRVPLESSNFKGLTFHKYDSRDFQKDEYYGYDDGIYIGSIDKFLPIFQTNGVGECVWYMEWWMKWLFDNYEHHRWGCELNIFGSIYLHGRNTSPEDLKTQTKWAFGMKPDFDKFITL